MAFYDHSLKIRWGLVYSNFQKIESGFPQGSILSPILYNIYAVDTPEVTKTTTYADEVDRKMLL